MYFSRKTGQACVLQVSQVVLIAMIANFERRVPGTRLEFYTLSTDIDLGTRPVKFLKEALIMIHILINSHKERKKVGHE